MTAPIRTFNTGATRDTDAGKWDFDGFFSPLVFASFASYMHKHRCLPDGSLRASDNWQKGLPRDETLKSAWRHFFDLWAGHRGCPAREGIEDACNAILFNVSAYLHEHLKAGELPRVISHDMAAAMKRDLMLGRAESDDDGPDHNPITPAGAQSGTPVSQHDEE